MLKVEFFFFVDFLYVNVFVDMLLGIDINVIYELVQEVEVWVSKVIEFYQGIVEVVLIQIGENIVDFNGLLEFGVFLQKVCLIVFFVLFKDWGELFIFDVMEDIWEVVCGIFGVKIIVDKNVDGFNVGKLINLEIQGEDIDQLVIFFEDVINYINFKNILGIEELQADIKIGKFELIINVDREVACCYGVFIFDIVNVVCMVVFGKEVFKFKEGEDEYFIFICLDEKYCYDIDDLFNQCIIFCSLAMGQIFQVLIFVVVDIKFMFIYSFIKWKNLDWVIIIYLNVFEGYYFNEIIFEID